MCFISITLILAVISGEVSCTGGGLKSMMMGVGMDLFGVTDTIQELGKAMEDGHKELVSASQAFTSKYHSLIDQIDEHALEELFAKLFPHVPRDTGNNSCVEGVKAGMDSVGSVTLLEGKIVYHTKIELKPVIKKEVGDYELSEVRIIFPSIKIRYKFKYTSASLIGWSRVGTLKLTQAGDNVVAVVVTLPRNRSVIDLLIKRKKCFIKVQSIDFRLGPTFVIDDVHYDSLVKHTIGVGYTESYVREIVTAKQEDIKETLKKTLKDLVTPATSNPEVFCASEVTHPEPIDCNKVNEDQD